MVKRMAKRQIYSEPKLAKLAKRFREKSGKTKAQLARELEITRATMQDVEERPERNLTKLRRRIIEKYSRFRVTGPVYLLETK
jgi:DNA-binding XRE family transcriptional regulator